MAPRSRGRRRKKLTWMRVKDAGAIKRWRTHRRLSQRDLAVLVGCSQNTIHLLESGRMITLSQELGEAVARRLDVPEEELFIRRENPGVSRMTGGASSGRRHPRAAA